MEFKRLGYFVQVAEQGSLSRVSEKLRLTQPSLSRQMRLLEEDLGVPLFTRGARGMQLTEAGEVLYARITGPMREIGRAIYEIRSLPTEAGGTVTLGIPPSLVQVLAGAITRRIAALAPNITFTLVDAPSTQLVEAVRCGKLDVAVVYGPTPAGMNAARLLEDDLMLVGPRASSLAAEGSFEIRRLGEIPLILPGAGHPLRQLVEAEAEGAKVKLNIACRADSHQMMKELVEAGLGYTLLPHCAFSREAALSRLTFARIRRPIRRQLFLALSPDAGAPKAALQVEGSIRQEVAALIENGSWSAARLCSIGDA